MVRDQLKLTFWTLSESLANRLKDRFDNLNRSAGKPSFRRNLLDVGNTADEAGPNKRKPASTLQKDSYGCVRWQPDLPENDSPESHEEKRVWLEEEFKKEQKDTHKVSQLMNETYATQRYSINQGIQLDTIRINWPFLFQPRQILNHFEHLMDFNLFDRLDLEVTRRADKMLRFFESQGNTSVATAAAQLSTLAEVVGNVEPKVYGTLTLLPLIFGEKKEELFNTVEDTNTAKDLENCDNLTHPHVIIKGTNPFESNCCAIVEGCVLAYNVNLRMALGLTFAAYYTFNIPYPESIALTLEFIQRVFVDINPTRGSKVKKSDKKRPAVSSKVRKLCDNLRDFDSDWNI